MGLIESTLARLKHTHERLKQPEAVRLQLLAHLFLARIHNVVKSSYDQYQQQQQQQQASGYDTSWFDEANQPYRWENFSSRQEQQTTATTLGVLVHRKQRNKVRARRDSGTGRDPTRAASPKVVEEPNASDQSHAEFDWDWRGFPAMWRPFALYDLASTSWMVWASLRSLLRDQLAALLNPVSQLLFGLPGNCLLLGRLATPVAVSHLASLVLSSFHLCWRLVQSRANRNRLITVIVFLMASERDVSQAYEMLERNLSRHRGEDDDDNNKELRLFRQVMCYPVHGHGGVRVHFKLRPNRTREAREKLKDRTALVTLVTLAFFGFLLFTVWALVFLAVISDYRYVHVYPGCYPLLDDLLARGQLSFFSVTPWNHHLISSVFDGFENTFIWLDCGLSIICVPAFTYLLNYDLLLYWSALNLKMQSLAERTRWSHLMLQWQADNNHHQNVDHAPGCVRWSIESAKLPISRTTTSSSFPSERAMAQWSSSPAAAPPPYGFVQSLRTLEADIHELQFEMFDFFHQVQRTDLFVGDVLTAAILIWLAGCGFVTYNHITFNGGSPTSIIVELILVLSFFVISLATYHLLELRHRCLASHQMMCSLIAHDRTRKKRHFKKVMDFYLDDSTSYHLCRTYAYKPTTFMTIIGWTFSCFFITFTLFKPE